ncbi:MAG: IS66 family transposase [Bacteroidota bacterium]
MEVINILRKEYIDLEEKYHILAIKNEELEAENNQFKSEQIKQKVQAVNKTVNQPTSKQPEWETKGVGNDGKGKKKGRGHKGRKGAGNKTKNLIVTHHETAKVERCDICGRDLSDQPPLKSENTRTIEDIPEIPIVLKVIEVKQEKKYCHHCKQVITASTDLALPRADFGLNTTISIIYLWTVLCLSFTKISDYLNNFFGQKISTSGLSDHIIAVSKIMKAVYDEILNDVKSGNILHADETGWRVSGKNWWLWVFGTIYSVFYTIDKSRGSDVVRRVLGEIFFGVLVVDGWKAYLATECKQQSCMAHLLRKIRKLNEAFPQLGSVYKFYIKFRKILRDGERLQKQREELGEGVFKRRLDKLHTRLDELLKWANPNDILKDIIAKVDRQRPRILTFVEHPGVACHNNFGEYLIRIGVLKRKISFGSKSVKGAEAYAVLLSICSTCKLRDIPFLDFMKTSLKHYIRTGKPMLLKEYQDHIMNAALAA